MLTSDSVVRGASKLWSKVEEVLEIEVGLRGHTILELGRLQASGRDQSELQGSANVVTTLRLLP